jgi:hypothetical protein
VFFAGWLPLVHSADDILPICGRLLLTSSKIWFMDATQSKNACHGLELDAFSVSHDFWHVNRHFTIVGIGPGTCICKSETVVVCWYNDMKEAFPELVIHQSLDRAAVQYCDEFVKILGVF